MQLLKTHTRCVSSDAAAHSFLLTASFTSPISATSAYIGRDRVKSPSRSGKPTASVTPTSCWTESGIV
jgi:hypothetical protein